MIEKIQQVVSNKYDIKEPKGVFLSGYDQQKNLVLSSGVVTTDKPLEKVIEMLYHGLIENHKEICCIACDIVQTIQIINSIEEIMKINTNEYGICASTIDHTKSGVILPGTMGINNASEALSFIKSKHSLSGNITAYVFTTDRLFIE